MKQPMKNWIIVAAPWTFEELYSRNSRMKHSYDDTIVMIIEDIQKDPRKTSNHTASNPTLSNEVNYTV